MSRHDPINSTTVRSSIRLALAQTLVHTAFGISERLGARVAERLFTTPSRHRRPDRERDVLATGHRFDIDMALRSPHWKGARRRIAAWKWGSGPAVILVHGWEGRGAQLGALIEPLVDAGMSVVAFDAPAHGDSTGRRLYLTDHAEALAAVIAHVGGAHAVITHSFGAASLLVAHRHAGVDVARNIAIAPNAIIDDAIFRFTQVLGLGTFERTALEDRLAERTGYHPASLHVETLAGDRDAALLVVHDTDDKEVPPFHGRRLADAWPAARHITTRGLGHRRILRDPSVIADIVAFATAGAPTQTSDLRRAMVDAWAEGIDESRILGVVP
jgi:hypothetical protein